MTKYTKTKRGRPVPLDKFVTYVFCYPSGLPYYVGCGKPDRLRGLWRANTRCNSVTELLRSIGARPLKEVFVFDTREEAAAKELEILNKCKRLEDGGFLTNYRIGDRGGVQGRKMSEECKQHMSKMTKGVPLKQEHRQKISDGLLKHYQGDKA